MAKSKGTTNRTNDGGDDATTAKRTNPGFKGHHKQFKDAGYMLLETSRPRGSNYQLEQWLSPDKTLMIVKAADTGRLTRYAEQQQTDDAAELTATR